jgi:DivIVA domain-containing protein|nr:MAG TPA: cell division protein [Bacteriophage sp.]
MYQERILLTVQDILDKEFKIDTRGYRPQEVDKFLDVIIRDYEEMSSVIKELETEKKSLIEDNIRLKQEIRNMSTKLDVLKDSDLNESSSTNNADVLRRLSNLEKIIYGRE